MRARQDTVLDHRDRDGGIDTRRELERFGAMMRRCAWNGYFSVDSGTKCLGVEGGGATASFRTLNTRWSSGDDARKSA